MQEPDYDLFSENWATKVEGEEQSVFFPLLCVVPSLSCQCNWLGTNDTFLGKK